MVRANTLSDSATIRIQVNVISNVEFTSIVWGETSFKNTFETSCQIEQPVVSHQKPLPLFRKITTLSVFSDIGVTEPLKYADTRYGSRVIMGRCLLVTRSIYRNLMGDMDMETCLQRARTPIPRNDIKLDMLI